MGNAASLMEARHNARAEIREEKANGRLGFAEVESRGGRMPRVGDDELGANDGRGDVYVGEVGGDGERRGQGKMTFANGDVYEGGWKDGKMSGYGKKIYAEGNKVEEGLWKGGKLHYSGTFRETFEIIQEYECCLRRLGMNRREVRTSTHPPLFPERLPPVHQELFVSRSSLTF